MLIKEFEEQVRKTPGNIAVKKLDRYLTYQELNQYANSIALLIQRNWRADFLFEHVGLFFEHGIDIIAAILGTLKACKVYIPLSTDYPFKRISYILEHSRASLVLTNSACKGKLEKLARENGFSLVCIDEPETLPIQEDPENISIIQRTIDGEKPAYIMYTSGSTGKPKGVVQNHFNVLYYIKNWTQRFNINEFDRMTLFSSFCHDGSVQDMFGALLNGAALYPFDLRSRSDIQVAQFIISEKITIWHSVPSLFNFFVNSLSGLEKFEHLNYILLGGEPFRGYEIEMFKKHFPSAILANVYGQTESSVNSIWTIHADDTINKFIIGDPLDNTRVLLIDEEGNEVEPLNIGEIVVACPHISPGYWNAESPSPNFGMDPDLGHIYWTGDLGRLLPDGNIEFMGRKDFQVKIRGFRVELGEIETTLLRCPDIIEAAVVTKETEGKSSLYLWGYLTAKKRIDVTKLREYLAAELPDYMIPSYFVQLDQMPLTQSGKLDRKTLAAMEEKPMKRNVSYIEPKTKMERIIADVWKEVLGIDEVSIHDNLFDLGGNSFDIIKINHKLNELLYRNISIIELFKYSSISQLSDHLVRQAGTWDIANKFQVSKENEQKRVIPGNEIAVIGMAGRFPGAENVDRFWENLKNGLEALAFFTEEELVESGIDKNIISNPNYRRVKGALETIEYFDASFFNYTPKEAELMDPQLRLLHECAWEALEIAGYNSRDFNGKIGLFAGNLPNYHWVFSIFFQLIDDPLGQFDALILNSHFSTRVSYNLNLRGPSIYIKTACSTSLVAIHLACKALLNNECDMALAGGVSISLPKKSGYIYQEGMIFSVDGHVRAFDADASGTVFGDGAGIVLLKRLANASADGDCIDAVIKGSAVNNDGFQKVGYTAPSIDGQAEVIRDALFNAGVEPASISYIETHGTATKLGDPIELEALNLVFYRGNPNSCAVGSVKTNIGHLNAAAGAASFIKTVMALKHKLIPPSLHFNHANPEFNFSNSPFYVNTTLKEWKSIKGPLRAGVSSFGFGGTNAHIVLEEAQPVPNRTSDNSTRMEKLILLSANTPTAREKISVNLTGYLKNNSSINLDDVAYTLQIGRKTFSHRRFLVCTTIEEAIQELNSCESSKVHDFYTKNENSPVIFMFPGQGSQYINMGLGLYKTEKTFREEVDRCFDILRPLMSVDPKKIIYPNDNSFDCQSQNIDQTEFTQPILFVIEYALAKLLMKWGIMPDAMIGHSIGEYVAACLSGIFSLEDALRLVSLRGKLIQQLPRGSMVSIPLEEHEFISLSNDQLDMAAINTTFGCVVSGKVEAIEAFSNQIQNKGYEIKSLHTSHAFHSRMMEPILDEFEEAVGKITLKEPMIPFVSNVTGDWINDYEAQTPRYWADHIRRTVRFSDGISLLLNRADYLFIEVGPGRTLSGFVRQHREKKEVHHCVNLIRHPKEEITDSNYLLNSVGQMYLLGNELNWNAFYEGEKRYRLHLPTYPFERKYYWVDNSSIKINSEAFQKNKAPLKRKDIADWFNIPLWKRSVVPLHESHPSEHHCRWLVLLDQSGLGSLLIERLKQKGNEVVTAEKGMGFENIGENAYIINPRNEEDYHSLLDTLKQQGKSPDMVLHLFNISGDVQEKINDNTRDIGEKIYDSFFSLIFFARAAGKNSNDNPTRLIVTTDRMQEVIGGDLIYPEKALLTGVIEEINAEYPNILCRTIDVFISSLDIRSDSQLIDRLVDEITSECKDTFIAYRGNYRWVKTFEHLHLLKRTAEGEKLIKGGVYWIIGGLTGFGFVLSTYLAKQLNARLVLLEGKDFSHEQSSEKIHDLKKAGAEVFVFNDDITDIEAMKHVLSCVKLRFEKVNGIFYWIGDSFDGYIRDIPNEKTENTLISWIKGVRVLDIIMKEEQLDIVAFNSSLASPDVKYGQVVQSSIGAFLDHYAYYMNSKSAHTSLTISLKWDRVCQSGSSSLAFTEIDDLFDRIPDISHPQVIVSTSEINECRQQTHEPPNILEFTDKTGNDWSETAKKLTVLWQQLFGFDHVDINDNFFEIGGDSVKAMTLLSKIFKTMEVKVPIAEIFNNPTIKGLSTYIDNTNKKAYIAIEASEKKEYYRLSSAQYRLYLAQLVRLDSTIYNVPIAVILEGEVDEKILETTFKNLIERHGSLRTSIEIVNDEPVQRIHNEVNFEIGYYPGENGDHDYNGDNLKEIVGNFIKPFILSQVPLLRIGLVKERKNHYILMVDMHHIITDGLSQWILVKEFMSFYSGKKLSPPTIQYHDFSEWQCRMVMTDFIKKQEEYWNNRFKGNIPMLNLPFDFSEESNQKSTESNYIDFSISKELTTRVYDMLKKTDTTLYMFLLSVFNILMAKYTQQEDVLVGSPVTGRRYDELQGIIGMFVNMLVMRNQPSSDKTFYDFLKEVKANSIDAFENQDFQFEELVRMLDLPRNKRNPLFNVVFTVQNIDTGGNSNDGIPNLSTDGDFPFKAKPYKQETKACPFDIIFSVVGADETIRMEAAFSIFLFRRSTIEGMVNHYIHILEQVVNNINIKINEIFISHGLLKAVVETNVEDESEFEF